MPSDILDVVWSSCCKGGPQTFQQGWQSRLSETLQGAKQGSCTRADL